MEFLEECFEGVLLREKFPLGYGDRRGEASFASESVDFMKMNLIKYEKLIKLV